MKTITIRIKPSKVQASLNGNVNYSPIDSSVVNNQTVEATITENGRHEITYDRLHYTGIDTAILSVAVPPEKEYVPGTQGAIGTQGYKGTQGEQGAQGEPGTLDLENFYTKDEIDSSLNLIDSSINDLQDQIDNIEIPADVLDNYYTKDEIDASVNDI